jgi:hypothetical protein
MALISSMLTAVMLSLVSVDPPGEQAAPAPTTPSTAVAKGKKKVIRLDAITVEGHIQKPQAFYILQRSNLNFEELTHNESFIPKITKSVEQAPF